MSRRRRLLGVYARIGRTYVTWWRTLVLLALIVFVPLGLVDAVLHHVEVRSLEFDDGFHVATVLAAIAATTVSGLFGEVFFSGAIAASLTHPESEPAPSFGRLARHISYGRLIAVDLLYVLFVALGLIVLILPGLALLVYLSLAGPVLELEGRGIRDSFRRSFRLVRGHFWLAAAVVIPVEVIGDAINDQIVAGAHAALGDGILAAWLGEAVGNVVTAPVFSVAVVLLTLDLIHHRDGSAPPLRRGPRSVAAAGAA